jgi:hypothetical protein
MEGKSRYKELGFALCILKTDKAPLPLIHNSLREEKVANEWIC